MFLSVLNKFFVKGKQRSLFIVSFQNILTHNTFNFSSKMPQKKPYKQKTKEKPVAITPKISVKMEKDFDVDPDSKISRIDGSSMEGGGQILRNTVSLSAILQKPVKIVNIRAKRDKPGLKPQHLTGIQLVRDLVNAKLVGGTVNSASIIFDPSTFAQKSSFLADTKTAGSIGLLIQIALPVALFAPHDITLELRGGTNAEAAPQIDYMKQVFQPISEKFGFKFDLEIQRRGFYPQGGGIAEIKTKPIKSVLPITIIERGKLVSITSRAFVSGQIPLSVADRMNKSAKDLVMKQFTEMRGSDEWNVVQETVETAFGTGTGIIILGKTDTGCIIAASALGEKGKPAEQVGEEAGKIFIDNVLKGGCVDEYLQDQLIIFMALAKGKSQVKTGPLTLHTQTSIHFSECLTGAKFEVTECNDRKSGEETFLITCEGIGFENKAIEQKNENSNSNSNISGKEEE